MKDERERAFFGNKTQRAADSDSDEEETMNFTKLYSRSIIVGQKWPWTKLVDIESDRQFFRNEMLDYFQFEAPPEFGGALKADKNGSLKGTGSTGEANTDGGRRRGMIGLQETTGKFLFIGVSCVINVALQLQPIALPRTSRTQTAQCICGSSSTVRYPYEDTTSQSKTKSKGSWSEATRMWMYVI